MIGSTNGNRIASKFLQFFRKNSKNLYASQASTVAPSKFGIKPNCNAAQIKRGMKHHLSPEGSTRGGPRTGRRRDDKRGSNRRRIITAPTRSIGVGREKPWGFRGGALDGSPMRLFRAPLPPGAVPYLFRGEAGKHEEEVGDGFFFL